METKIFFETINNKLVFKLILSMELIDDDAYFELDETIIYECDSENFNLDEFYKNIDIINNKLKKAFPNKNETLDKNNLTMFTNDTTFDNDDVIFYFLRNNKNLNILIQTEDSKSLIEKLKDEDYPNLKINFNNSDNTVSYKDFYTMFSKLYEIVDFINYYKLSPLEKILLVYDIVKANEYKEEEKNEDYSTSRDLNQIINTDKIVCVGFSNLMDFLLTNLGFECNKIHLDYIDKPYGHQRNFIKLKDDKYGIDGIFFLDATWDSKKDINYIDNYRFFLRPISYFRNINPNEIIDSPSYFRIFNDKKDEVIKKIENDTEFDLIKLSVTISALLKKKNSHQPIVMLFNGDNEKIEQKLDEVFKYYNQNINEESFKNALYKVRRIEYINNIIKEEPKEQYIDSVCEKRYPRNAQYKLLQAIFGSNDPTLDDDLEEIKADSIEQDLLRIRLLRALKTKLNDFPENDYIKKM